MAAPPILRVVSIDPAGPAETSEQARDACPLDGLSADLTHLREALFAAGDRARHALPYDHAGLHVALQAAAHQLGEAQRMLASPTGPPRSAAV